MTWLYRCETKGIQSWILETNKLRDLAGGSALVESLTRIAAQQAEGAGAKILQSTSGSMTAEFEDKASLEKFASTWPMQVAYLAPGLQLLQAWVPGTARLEALFPKLAAKRNCPRISDLQAGPWVLRTGSSGRPAIGTPKKIRTNARKTQMDEASLAKERARGSDKSGFVTGGYAWSDFEEEVDRWAGGGAAVIHADGSGVGQRLLGLSSEELRKFSAALKEASKAATRAAVDTLERVNGKFQARPIVSAGDDLTYLVRAPEARLFAQTWLQTLETETAKSTELGGKMWGGAGFVYVHGSYPFAQAYEMAEKLCTKAKDRIKETDKKCSVIAFRRITNSWVEDVWAGATGWILNPRGSECPLEQLVASVSRLPRGSLRTWLEQFDRGQNAQAQKLWDRCREVADPKDWHAFETALTAVGANPNDGSVGDSLEQVFSLTKGHKATPLRDALALRFIESSGGNDD